MSEDRILDRVRKMLDLANDAGATEGERDNALRMAYATLAKYNLTEADLARRDGTRTQSEPRKIYDLTCWSMPWARQIAETIATLFFCEFYYNSHKVNATQMKYRFVGTESNATTAMLMTAYIINSILKEGRSKYKHNLSPQTRAFATGAADKLAVRVWEIREEREKQQQAETGTALALVDLYKSEREANQLVIKNNGITVKLVKDRSQPITDADSYNAGKTFGGKIGLGVQVSGTEQVKLK